MKAPLVLAVSLFAAGCARAPSPLSPGISGSIGMPQRGVLTDGAELPRDAEGIRWLRTDDRHWGAPRFVAAIERAAEKVEHERPGPPLVIGDLSSPHGGQSTRHMSHRNGHDVDLLLFVQTLSGAPVPSPGFVRFDADGIAWDDVHHRWLRFDVERTWLLVKALVEDDDARVEWLFLSRPLQGLVTEWALARGEPTETVLRAVRLLLQPGPPAETHDDHLHVRVACDADEMARGCEPTGPLRPWHPHVAPLVASAESDASIVADLLAPIESGEGSAGGGAVSSGLAP